MRPANLQPGVDRAADLLRCEPLQWIVMNHFGVEFLPDARTKQVAQLHQVEMAMHTPPTANLVMIQPQFLFGLAKTTFHRPPTKGDTQQPPQIHAVLARHTVRYEVFHFARQNVAGHDQALPPARPIIGPLTPKHGPFYFPDFRAACRVLDAVTLPTLLLEHR